MQHNHHPTIGQQSPLLLSIVFIKSLQRLEPVKITFHIHRTHHSVMLTV